jgi:hypothetical protein
MQKGGSVVEMDGVLVRAGIFYFAILHYASAEVIPIPIKHSVRTAVPKLDFFPVALPRIWTI